MHGTRTGGAMQVLRPVIVWITLLGLPLHFWGKEGIKAILAPFGKLHKLDDNFYKKERVDYVKAMVEVEDISLVPKSVKCSYKALTDELVQAYSVSLMPASTCLPVSEWNDETYKSYAEDGGSGGYVEQDWSRREEVPRRAPRRAAVGGDEEEGEAEEDSTQAPRHVPLNAALNAGASEGRQEDFREPTVVMADFLEEECERRRTGKGIQIVEGHGPSTREGPIRPINISSGSGSCDPNVMGAQFSQQAAGSDEADSKAGPTHTKEQEGMSQDFDLGGEGGVAGGEKVERSGGVIGGEVGGNQGGLGNAQVEAQNEITDPTPVTETVAVMGPKNASQAGGDEGRRKLVEGGGRSSSTSVSPGFRKIQKPRDTSGVSSPFGKL